MVDIKKSVDQLIGKTPLLRLCRLEKAHGALCEIVAKLEYLNPAGSVKDRVACRMIDAAEEKGILTSGATIIEPTSGNTGIGLCVVAAVRGYHAIIVMPDTMSEERIRTMRAYGAEVVLTDGKLGMSGAIKKAEELSQKIPNSYIPGQFVNPANPEAHYLTTGPEIWNDTDGAVDIFVAGIGTGGTITGTARYLKEKNANIKIIGVEPAGSAVLSGNAAGSHKLQGIGAGFIPDVLDMSLVDEIVAVADDDALAVGRELGRTEGILVGISSGAAAYAAAELACRPGNAGKRIVVLLPDTGDRYLSTELFE